MKNVFNTNTRCSVDGRKRYGNDKCGRKSFLKRNKTRAFSFENGVVWTGSKGGEIRDTKNLNMSRNIVSLLVSRFSPRVINLARNKNICCKLRKVVAKSKARVYFEQQNLDLLLGFHETRNLSRDKSAHTRS